MLHFLIMLFKRGGDKDPANLSDEALVEQYRNTGDRQLAGELYKRTAHLVLGICMKYLKDQHQAEDAVMDIYEKLLNDLRTHEVQHFKSWLYMVSKNHCLMKLRKDQTQLKRHDGYEDFVKAVMENEEPPHLNGTDTDDAATLKLEKALQELNEGQRECVILFYLDGKSYKDIVDQTGYSDKQVKSFIQNGKRNLKLMMEKNHE